MSTAIPITRSSRMVTLTATAGQLVFTFNAGPVWDTADLVVQSRLPGAARFSTLISGFTLALVSGGIGGATATFAVAPRPTAGDPAIEIRIASRRTHERVTDVSRAGRIHTPSIEREHDELTTTLQELRRDIDQNDTDLQADLAGVILGQIPDNSLSLAKLMNTTSGVVLGRTTAGTGPWQALSAAVLRMLIKSREQTGAVTFYVNRTTGSDSNDGRTTGTAVATLQKACDLAYSIDSQGADVTISVAGAGYAAGLKARGPLPGGGRLVVFGNEANPLACDLTATNDDLFLFTNGARAFVYGFAMTTVSGSGCHFRVTTGADVIASANYHGAASESYVTAEGGQFFEFGSCSWAGSAVSAVHSTGGGQVLFTGTVTIVGTPSFSAYVVGTAGWSNITFDPVTFAGNVAGVTGRRFLAHNGGQINVGSNDRNFFPGSLPGIYDDFGTYVGSSTWSGSRGHLYFNSTQDASTDPRCLDDYQEGTFTPVLRFGGATTGITYSANGQIGRFQKVGNRVHFKIQFNLTSKGTATGSATITGLPYAHANDLSASGVSVALSAFVGAMSFTGTAQPFIASGGSSTITLQFANNGVNGNLNDTHFTNSTVLVICGTYETTN